MVPGGGGGVFPLLLFLPLTRLRCHHGCALHGRWNLAGTSSTRGSVEFVEHIKGVPYQDVTGNLGETHPILYDSDQPNTAYAERYEQLEVYISARESREPAVKSIHRVDNVR